MRRLLPVAVLLCACSEPSQLVMGFATTLSAPDAIDTVQLQVKNAEGVIIGNDQWVLPGKLAKNFSLPGSFTLTSDNGGTPTVHVEVDGLKNGANVVSRVADIQLASSDELFIRLTLVQDCEGMTCEQGKTCIEGKCKSPDIFTVSLIPYEPALVTATQCDSGESLIDTATGAPMPTTGSGTCAADEWCGEAICYKNLGQGLLWCGRTGSAECTGIDGYERCQLAACTTELANAYGADWTRGTFSGPCASYASCVKSCACDPTCFTGCSKPAACQPLVDAANTCVTSAGCTEPACPWNGDGDGADGSFGYDGGASSVDLFSSPQDASVEADLKP